MSYFLTENSLQGHGVPRVSPPLKVDQWHADAAFDAPTIPDFETTGAPLRARGIKRRRMPDEERVLYSGNGVYYELVPHDGPASSHRGDDSHKGPSLRRLPGKGISFERPGVLSNDCWWKWKREMILAMTIEQVDDLVMGHEPEDWNTQTGRAKIALALAGIQGQLSPSLQAQVQHIESPRELWAFIENHIQSIANIQLDVTVWKFETLKLQDCRDIDEYSQKFSDYAAQLKCTDPNYELPTWYLSVKFMNGLGPRYGRFVADFLTQRTTPQHTPPDFWHVAALAKVEEQQRRRRKSKASRKKRARGPRQPTGTRSLAERITF